MVLDIFVLLFLLLPSGKCVIILESQGNEVLFSSFFPVFNRFVMVGGFGGYLGFIFHPM